MTGAWPDLMDRLDEAAFAHLADDLEATWTPAGGAPVGPLRVMVGPVTRPAEVGGMNLVVDGEAARFLVADLEGLIPGRRPAEGDTVTVGGRTLVLRGQGWTESDGRDWVCSVSG